MLYSGSANTPGRLAALGGLHRPAAAAVLQPVSDVAAFNEQRLRQLQGPLGRGEYLSSADFRSRTFQNCQSEFLAVGSMAVLSVYLRQRGSPESKPVKAAHHATGIEG